jgi:AraC-like DNA-binding protein
VTVLDLDDPRRPAGPRPAGGAPVPLARGVLRTPPPDRFELRRWEPGDAVAPVVTWHWAVRWDLRGVPAHEQVVLPHPSAHLTVESDGVWLTGPQRRGATRTLSCHGEVVGTRLRPGRLRALLGAPAATITDRRLPADALPGLDVGGLAKAAAAAPDLDGAVAALEDALAPLVPTTPDPGADLAERAVRLLEEDRALTRVTDLADRLAVSVRSLQRVFAEHVGLGPAWVVRRLRLQEAAAHATGGGQVDWARLAADLGYADQAHLVRDFTAAVGVPPARYARGAPG